MAATAEAHRQHAVRLAEHKVRVHIGQVRHHQVIRSIEDPVAACRRRSLLDSTTVAPANPRGENALFPIGHRKPRSAG